MRHSLKPTVFCFLCAFIVGCGGGGYSELAEQANQQVEPPPSLPAERTETDTAPAASGTAAERSEPAATGGSGTTNETAPASPLTRPVPTARRGTVSGVLGARNRNTAMNNGKQIALAMHQYESAAACFPKQAIVNPEGTPLLSWRVELLKSIDRNLYDAFNHDVAWDHPDNKPLIEKMPSIFDTGYPLLDGHTAFMVVTGDETMFPDPTKNKRGLKPVSYTHLTLPTKA